MKEISTHILSGKSERISSAHGGIVPVLKAISDFGLPTIIRKCLGKRNYRARYGYDDIIISSILANFCGGQRIDHVTKLKKNLSIVSQLGLSIPSHDVTGRALKNLATETITKRGTAHNKKISHGKFNDNFKMNKLLIEGTKSCGLINEGQRYTLDMDATFIETKCYESAKSYHQIKGFYPMVSCINKLPVYINMRNGNVAPGSEIKECLENTMNLLEEQKIKIDRIRMDKASYNSSAFDYLNAKNIKFYVPVAKKSNIVEKLKACDSWKAFSLETRNYFWDCETANIPHTLHKAVNEYRIVALRIPILKKEKDSEWLETGKYAYKLIITNDFTSSAEEVHQFYNHRGTSEQNFHNLKSQHGWKYPPFSFVSENLVFLITMALANNVYQAVLEKFKKALPELKVGNLRLKKFRKIFINVVVEYINGIFYFNDGGIDFEKIV